MAKFYPECVCNLSVVFDGFGGPDQPETLVDIIPLSGSFHLKSYKEGDSWEITFDAKRFPFSPELIRSAAIEVYLYQKESLTVNAMAYKTVIPATASSGVTFSAGLPSYAIAALNADKTRRDRLLVTGLIDVASITLSTDGGSVSMSGRDYTGLLTDREWNPLKSGKAGRVPDGPLDQVVQSLVDEATNAKEIGTTLQVTLVDYEVDPIQKNVSKTITSTKVKIPPTSVHTSKTHRQKRGIAVKADSTYWDVIYKLCVANGYICFVQGFNVYITKPHVLQADQEQTWGHWRVAYGRNLEKLEVTRKMAKDACPQIRINSYNSALKQTITGVFPDDTDHVALDTNALKGHGINGGAKSKFKTRSVTGVGTKRDDYRVYTERNDRTVAQLKELARTTYYALSRGEGTVKLSTPNLKDLDNGDLLKIKSGDAIYIKWDAFNSDVMMNNDIPAAQKIATLQNMGYSLDVATLVATQYDKLDYFRQNFYVKTVEYAWDVDSGIQIDVEAMNYINAERDGSIDGTTPSITTQTSSEYADTLTKVPKFAPAGGII